jgi:hypothetical protein
MVLQSNGYGVRVYIVTVMVLQNNGDGVTSYRLWCSRVTVMVLLQTVMVSQSNGYGVTWESVSNGSCDTMSAKESEGC